MTKEEVFLTKEEITKIARTAIGAMFIECNFQDSIKNVYMQSFLYYLGNELERIPVVRRGN